MNVKRGSTTFLKVTIFLAGIAVLYFYNLITSLIV